MTDSVDPAQRKYPSIPAAARKLWAEGEAHALGVEQRLSGRQLPRASELLPARSCCQHEVGMVAWVPASHEAAAGSPWQGPFLTCHALSSHAHPQAACLGSIEASAPASCARRPPTQSCCSLWTRWAAMECAVAVAMLLPAAFVWLGSPRGGPACPSCCWRCRDGQSRLVTLWPPSLPPAQVTHLLNE